MPKKFSEVQKKELVNSFLNGKTVDQLSDLFNFSKMTIVRNLKIILGESAFKKFVKNNPNKNTRSDINKKIKSISEIQQETQSSENIEEITSENIFFEITPLDNNVYDVNQKDFASVPIADIDFPKIVYMIVDKNIELEIKLLKDYPDWNFLSPNELNRKTIEIFLDKKVAKSFCNKEQKIIKIPNTEVFRIVAPILLSRGISRIVSANKLIAL